MVLLGFHLCLDLLVGLVDLGNGSEKSVDLGLHALKVGLDSGKVDGESV